MKMKTEKLLASPKVRQNKTDSESSRRTSGQYWLSKTGSSRITSLLSRPALSRARSGEPGQTRSPDLPEFQQVRESRTRDTKAGRGGVEVGLNALNGHALGTLGMFGRPRKPSENRKIPRRVTKTQSRSVPGPRQKFPMRAGTMWPRGTSQGMRRSDQTCGDSVKLRTASRPGNQPSGGLGAREVTSPPVNLPSGRTMRRGGPCGP